MLVSVGRIYDTSPCLALALLFFDILNYLGFVNRKMNKIEDAEIYFVMGLELSPNHLSINEYLGELYVATNRIDLAKERLNVLKDCNCEEYNKLKKIIEES